MPKFDTGTPKVWAPKTVNRRATGQDPTGAWSPQQQGRAGSQSPSPTGISALAAVGSAGAGLGIQPFYSTVDVPVSTYGEATVNLATGNLVLQTQAVKYDSPGVPVDVAAFANSLATGVGSMGAGALLNTGQDVGLAIGTSAVTFYGPSGFTAVFNPSGTGGWIAPAGMNADLARRPDATWTLTYHGSGEAMIFSSGGYLIKDVDRNGLGLSLAYNSSNKLISLTDGAGRVTTFAYNSAGFVSSIVDPFRRTTTYGYATTTGVMNTITYPDGSVVNLPSQPASLTSMIQSPNGNWAKFTYDSTHRVIQLDRYLTAGAQSGTASTTKFTYTSSTAVSVTNPLGGVTIYTLDSLGRTTKVVDPLGRSTLATWTANNDVATETDADGKVTTFTYDAANNPTGSSAPTGATTSATYTSTASCPTTDTAHPYDVKCATDDAGKTQALTYDAAGNPVAVQDTTAGGTGAKETFSYQSADTTGTQCGGKPGQVCSHTDARGKTTTYSYDPDGNQVKMTPPAPLAVMTRTYDSAGRVTSQTDGLKQTTSFTYDIDDRITSTTLSTNGATITNTYDNDGNLTKTVDSEKGTTSYTFDTLDREVSRLAPGMSTAATTGYDAAGDITSASDPRGQMTYAFNSVSELTSLTEPGGPTTSFSYDSHGQEATRTLPNGVVQTTTRDASGRPTVIKAVRGSGQVVSDLSYSYAADGADHWRVQTRTDRVGTGAPAGSVTTYSYDSLGQLTSAVEKTPTGAVNASWAYTYDASGDRLTQTTTGATSPTTTAATPAATTQWTYNDANQVSAQNSSTTGWSYDADGQQTSSPTWGTGNYTNRGALASVTTPGTTSTTTFDYLGLGNTTRTRAGTTSYSTSALGLATADTSNSGTAVTSFHYTNDGQLLASCDPAGNRQYYLTDNLGSIVAITDATGAVTATYSYGPYGTTRTATGTAAAANPFRYIGGYLDTATGLYKLGARYYDPATGRFTQLDPSGQDPHYVYSANDPINAADPSGLSATHMNGCSGGAPQSYGRAYFRPFCNIHDLCYHYAWTPRETCDRTLNASLVRICDGAYRWYDYHRATCRSIAAGMYWGLRIGGRSHYRGPQMGRPRSWSW